MSYTIATRDVAAQPTATIRAQISQAEIATVLGKALPEVWAYLESIGLQPSGPPFALYHQYGPDSVDLEAGFPVPAPVAGGGRVVGGVLPAGTVAVTEHFGSYNGLPAAYDALAAWLTAHGHDPMAAAPWEIYWSDPGAEPDQARWRTEILWPLAGQAESG